MPIIATPMAQAPTCGDGTGPTTDAVPVLQPVDCRGLRVIAPATPKDATTGRPILTRTHAITIPGSQKATIEYTMRNQRGQPVDLRNCTCTDTGGSLSLSASSSDPDCDCPYQVVFRLQEYLGGDCVKQFPATIHDAAHGVVRVEFTAADTNMAGVYFGEFAIVECDSNLQDNPTADTTVVFSNQFYVHIGRDLWNIRKSQDGLVLGPPSIAEVRMMLRDSSAEESYLLDNVAFSDEEIAAATWMPVQYWNEIPPPIAAFTTSTFPYRYHWLLAITGHLFSICAEQQRRNTLTYSAGGVQIRDQDREPNYEQAAQTRLAEWKLFVQRKKAQINLEGAFASLGSSYGWRY